MEKINYWDTMKTFIHESWHLKLEPFFNSDEFQELTNYIKKQKQEGRKIYPVGAEIWKCFKETPLNELKIVFLGLSPYYQKDIADGLAFSCSKSKKEQPSLKILLNACEEDTKEKNKNRDPSLKRWANQGVLLLNSALTVEEMKPDKHLKVWEPFIEYLYDNVFSAENGLIFVYFGKDAGKFRRKETPFIHYSKLVEHPSFAYRQGREMKHDNLFTWCNKILESNNGKEFKIDWNKNKYDEQQSTRISQ